ncbi:MAG TPA: protein phosphatase 2C domain-containing protein [Jiangellaceae bacterium]
MSDTTGAVRMTVDYISEPAPGPRINEDLVVASNQFVLVLDGASHAAGVDTGCIHDVPWLVAQLGSQVADALLNDHAISLPDALAGAIDGVRARHADTCDLENPDSPSATVALLRLRARVVDYLVLADSPVILRHTNGDIEPIRDERIDHLPDYSLDTVRKSRNAPGGFWVASTSTEAAHQAVTGSTPVDSLASAALLSDGVTRLVERHGWTWAALLDALAADLGPQTVINAVRAADSERDRLATDRGKIHDDATAALCRFTTAT